MEFVWQDFSDNAIAAIFILFIGFILGKIVQRVVLKLMQGLEITHLFRRATKMNLILDNFVSSAISSSIYIVSFILALQKLGLLKYTLMILLGILCIALLISGFLYLLDLVPNLWARFSLRESGLALDKHLEVKNISGKIVTLGFQELILESKIHIPYYFLLKNRFKLN